MSHQDPTTLNSPYPHHQDLKTALGWLPDPAEFAAVGFRRARAWTLPGLTAAAPLSAWSAEETLTARFPTDSGRGRKPMAPARGAVRIVGATAAERPAPAWSETRIASA